MTPPGLRPPAAARDKQPAAVGLYVSPAVAINGLGSPFSQCPFNQRLQLNLLHFPQGIKTLHTYSPPYRPRQEVNSVLPWTAAGHLMPDAVDVCVLRHQNSQFSCLSCLIKFLSPGLTNSWRRFPNRRFSTLQLPQNTRKTIQASNLRFTRKCFDLEIKATSCKPETIGRVAVAWRLAPAGVGKSTLFESEPTSPPGPYSSLIGYLNL